MTQNTSYQAWFTQDLQQCFLIPDQLEIEPGLDIIYELSGNPKNVSLEKLSIYKCSPEIIKEHLYQNWKISLSASKQALLNLYTFSQKTGQEIDIAELSDQFKEGLQIASPQAQEILEISQSLVASITSAANSQESLSEAEQQSLFKRVFSQIPQLLDQFSEANLEAAAQDPDAWAEGLYQQVYAEIDAKKTEARNQQLASEIRESIAQGLRSAGVTPSIDWKQDQENENPSDSSRP